MAHPPVALRFDFDGWPPEEAGKSPGEAPLVADHDRVLAELSDNLRN